jgi:gliding motility-associated-like protein
VSEYTLNPIVVNPSGDTAVCIGDTITLIADPGYVSYVWSNGANTQQISVSQAGYYSYTATDQNGCVLQSQDTAHVVPVQHPAADIEVSDYVICLGQTTSTLSIEAVSGIIYTWYPGGIVNDSLIVSIPGQYTVIANDNGCKSYDTVQIASTDPPVLDLGEDIIWICSCDTIVSLTADVQGTYLWSNADTTQTTYIDGTGVYSVTVTDPNQCTVSDAVNVEIYCLTVNAQVADPPTATVFVGQNGVLEANAAGYPGVFSYVWSPSVYLDDSTKQTPAVQNILATTTFWVTATDNEHGCTAVDSVVLAVIPQGLVPMPNAFTPNGDGVNDVYGPYIPAALQNFWSIVEMRIYNRWGQLVYNGNGYWDGTYNNVLQPADTYVYYITLYGPDQNNPQQYLNYNLTGSFTLLH